MKDQRPSTQSSSIRNLRSTIMLKTTGLRPVVMKRSIIACPSRQLATKSLQNGAPSEKPSSDDQTLEKSAQAAQDKQKTTMTQAEKDQELMRKLAGISGEGGEAGIEYEDGKPVAMKRGVKNNMFRLI